MEVLLSKVTQQAMNYAIRTGITITSGYAMRQCGRLLKTVEGCEKQELAALQLRLEGKIRIISPAIDMIELIAARGNTSLESAVTLTKSLRFDIQSLGVRLAKAVGEEQLARRGSSRSKTRAENDLELRLIIAEIKKLLDRIEDAVPLINLAITTSGVNLSTTLPDTVSPSRMLQASTFLTHGDTQYNMTMPRAQQIGPSFYLSVYMLFAGHAFRAQDEEGIRETTWKEVMHKARVKLLRVPLDKVYDYPQPFEGNTGRANDRDHNNIPSEGRLHEFAYQLLIVEDLEDDRVHTFEEDEVQPGPYDGVGLAGLREIIPVHEISKIFYADTGKILNIGTDGESNNPILLFKRDVHAAAPREMMDHTDLEPEYDSDGSHTVGGSESDEEQSALDEQLRRESTADLHEEEHAAEEPSAHPWRLPPNLDLEWMAFEVYTEELASDSDLDESEIDVELPSSTTTTPQRADSASPGLASYFSKLNLRPSNRTTSTPPPSNTQLVPSPQKPSVPSHHEADGLAATPAIKTSLSLLEMLVRLTALQQFRQTSHLAVPDQLLNFFLNDSSTVGAGADSELRRRVRREARMRVGFDPYNESPIKRRNGVNLEEQLDGAPYGPDDASPLSPGEGRFDYDGYPQGRASPRSRSATPASPSSTTSSPIGGSRSKSSADVPLPSREFRPSLSSPSPLLRRATDRPSQYREMKQPSFRGPPTAPPTSSSPRAPQATAGAGKLGGERTPPTSTTRPS
ncbi:Ran-binding-domain-containing protein [Bimuria novae-zelandiae CBS 107.79]|uniref:Ran-binding-domain-containing protein n=1 Tax=Bimuria novae-zelandiae CBS 107.79 TaxID=1447943 RepID=A0A6A5UQ89_9PLEO|nr:Ran-binding-domain-containing protein [Bimuria novae-zelandiae CBS 107.79]